MLAQPVLCPSFRLHVEKLYGSVHNMIAIEGPFRVKLRETAVRWLRTTIEALLFAALLLEAAMAQYTIQVLAKP